MTFAVTPLCVRECLFCRQRPAFGPRDVELLLPQNFSQLVNRAAVPGVEHFESDFTRTPPNRIRRAEQATGVQVPAGAGRNIGQTFQGRRNTQQGPGGGGDRKRFARITIGLPQRSLGDGHTRSARQRH